MAPDPNSDPDSTPSGSQPLTAQEVRRIASLARIAVTDEEVARLQHDLSAVLGYMDRLSKLDLTDVEPLTSIAEQDAPLGDDIPGPTLDNQTLINLAPQSYDRYVRIPKVLDDSGAS
jgi:aspartyl-tRNA(Asn)/glutamyl-tRNA(Gln) amidotransferase subunit C